jgi:hypothetical protein
MTWIARHNALLCFVLLCRCRHARVCASACAAHASNITSKGAKEPSPVYVSLFVLDISFRLDPVWL